MGIFGEKMPSGKPPEETKKEEHELSYGQKEAIENRYGKGSEESIAIIREYKSIQAEHGKAEANLVEDLRTRRNLGLRRGVTEHVRRLERTLDAAKALRDFEVEKLGRKDVPESESEGKE